MAIKAQTFRANQRRKAKPSKSQGRVNRTTNLRLAAVRKTRSAKGRAGKVPR